MKDFINRLFLKKPIGNGMGDVFFWRYRLLSTPWLGIYIHKFERGDSDRCLHDHPWSFLAIILRGGYIEQMFTDPDYPERTMWGEPLIATYWRGVGSILWRPARTAHRITLDPTTPKPISLVFVGPKVRPWGFWTVNGWREWAKGQPNPICETK